MEAHRRVVTRIDHDGRSCLVSDGPPPVQFAVAATNVVEVAELWATAEPAQLPSHGSDPTLDKPAFLPAANESRFRLVRIAPSKQFRLKAALHRADLVECLVVLSGEIHLLLADGTDVLLAPGDSVVQLGTEHAWQNLADTPCTIAVFLLGAVRSTK